VSVRWGNEPADFWAEVAALHKTLPAGAVFGCTTAAWMQGLGVVRKDRVEILLSPTTTDRTSAKVIVRRSHLEKGEITEINRLPVTALHRTLRDLCLFSTPIDALIALDAALYKKRTNKAQLLRDPAAAKGRRGSARFRHFVALSEPAQSPMETRLRWLLITAGLPRPEVQTKLYDNGRLIGIADLYYPSARLVIEYDGGNHRDRLVSDD
jgi:hypothetical protein